MLQPARRDSRRHRIARAVLIGVLVAASAAVGLRPAFPAPSPRENGGQVRRAAAEQHYVEGRRLLDTRRSGAMLESVAELEAAVAADPQHVLAWTGLAEASALLALYSLVLPDAALPRAREAAVRALALDGSLAEAHGVLGLVRYLYDWDFGAAEESFLRALELDAEYASAAHWYAMMLAARGRHAEAAARIDQALAADPDSPLFNTKRSTLLTAAGRFDEAEAQLERTRARFPDDPLPLREWGFLELRRHAASGDAHRLESALDLFRRAAELSGGTSKSDGGLAYALGRLGRRSEAEAVLDGIIATGSSSFVPPMVVALAHLGLGDRADRDRALALLERAEEIRDPGLVYLCIKPGLESLYDEPRFQSLAERIGLPPPQLPTN